MPSSAKELRTGGLADFDHRELSNCRLAAKSLALLTNLFHTYNLGRLPSFFERLTAAPHLLHAQLRLLEESLATSNERLRGMTMQATREFCTTSRAHELARCLEHWRVRGEGSLATDPHDAQILDFALRINHHPHALDKLDVDGLRSSLSDEEIHDLVFGVAVWNGLALLERLAAPLIGRSLEMYRSTTSGDANQ